MYASCGRVSARSRGFSLVEMLLAIFILGIGVISIAALFPAGIALQRQATDDVIGPIVAKNALSTIRSKLSQSDFGSFQDFNLNPAYDAGIAGTFRIGGANGPALFPHVSGDWCWMRPGFLFDSPATPTDEGSIDVFSAGYTRKYYGLDPSPPNTVQLATEIPDGLAPSADPFRLFGIPYNREKYRLFLDPTVADTLDTVSQRLNEPLITFTQAERSWPQPGSGAGNVPPQYYWECMFRRTGGRVQVAVLVYRVTAPGGDPSRYSVARIDSTLLGASLPAGSMDATVQTPPLPMVYYAPVPGQSGSWPNRTNALAPTNTPANGYSQFPVADEIPNTHAGTPFGAGKTWDDWMAPGQIWVDNHGNLHAVRSGRLLPGTTATASPGNPNQGPVKLRRRIPIMPRAPVYGVSPTAPSTPPNQTPLTPNAYINAIWFLPNSDARGNTITPIYATVEEL